MLRMLKSSQILVVSCMLFFSSCAIQSERFQFSQITGNVESKQLDEISGCVVSRQHPDVLWVHNDSGDDALVYAIATSGKLLASVQLTGASAIDYEDIALGPGPDPKNDYIYIGDIGDNRAVRESVVIHRIKEPSSLENAVAKEVESFPIRYRGGSRDAESLFVDPETQDVYIVSKRKRQNKIFRVKAPLTVEKTNWAEPVGEIDIYWLVAGDVTRDGKKFLLRTTEKAYFWARKDQQSIVEALEGDAEFVPLKSEPQGEAICWSPDGQSYYTVSEGRREPIYYFTTKQKKNDEQLP